MILRTDAWSWKTAAPSERHDMKILIVGGGGREHAIAQAISKSPKCTKLYCAPGNAGIAALAECVPIGVMEFDKIAAFAKERPDNEQDFIDFYFHLKMEQLKNEDDSN